MKKAFFCIFCFMFALAAACKPAQNKPEENMPAGILSVVFAKTAFSINEDIDATIYIGMDDGYENYANEHPNFRIQLKVTDNGHFYGNVGGRVLKDLAIDPLLYDYSVENGEEPTFNYSETFTLPSELFVGNEGTFYIFLSLVADGLYKYIPYEFSYSVIDEQIEIIKVKAD